MRTHSIPDQDNPKYEQLEPGRGVHHLRRLLHRAGAHLHPRGAGRLLRPLRHRLLRRDGRQPLHCGHRHQVRYPSN